jgi:transposase
VDADRAAAACAQHRRTSRETPRQEIVNAIFYVLRTGCAWRMLPHDFPPWQTVYGHFARWRDDGTVERVHDALRDRLDIVGRDPMASAGIVDAQSVKGADTVGRDSRGYDAGKRVNGRKRHVVTDTLGLLLVVAVTAASVQDRDGGKLVLDRLRVTMPSVVTVFADGGTPAGWSPTPAGCCAWPWRSCASPPTRSASRSCRAAGWSSARWDGSCCADGCAATTNDAPTPQKR